MTGAIFKMYILLFALAAILPGFLVSFIRSRNQCDTDMDGGWIAGPIAYLIYAVLVYIGLVIFYWDDNLKPDDLLGFPMFIILGKPPALPGDRKSLTFPGFDEFASADNGILRRRIERQRDIPLFVRAPV